MTLCVHLHASARRHLSQQTTDVYMHSKIKLIQDNIFGYTGLDINIALDPDIWVVRISGHHFDCTVFE
jgi:hypothetical protein